VEKEFQVFRRKFDQFGPDFFYIGELALIYVPNEGLFIEIDSVFRVAIFLFPLCNELRKLGFFRVDANEPFPNGISLFDFILVGITLCESHERNTVFAEIEHAVADILDNIILLAVCK